MDSNCMHQIILFYVKVFIKRNIKLYTLSFNSIGPVCNCKIISQSKLFDKNISRNKVKLLFLIAAMNAYFVTYLITFVEEQTEISEDNPEFLPAIAVLELSQQVATKLVLKMARTTVMCRK